MEKIPSFTIDHNRLLRGIYVSRKDKVGGDVVTTFDIRMKEPNREPALHPGALHTIEHLAATYLRNDAEWKDRIVYWGPMGCLTGNYLLMRGDLQSRDIVALMQRTFRFVADFEGEVPGRGSPGLRQLPPPRPPHGPMGGPQISGGGVGEDDGSQPGLSVGLKEGQNR